MRLAFILSLFICPKDTARCGEASSPNDVIECCDCWWKTKSPGRWFEATCRGRGWGFWYQLEQIEFLGAADSRPAIIDPQFVENVFGVGAKSVKRDDQLVGQFRGRLIRFGAA